MHGRTAWAGVGLFLLALGCEVETAPRSADDVPSDLAAAFDSATAGTIEGQVRWHGELPQVPPFKVHVNPLGGPVLHTRHRRPNPNAPCIDPQTRGVADAVIFLKGVDPKKARLWDYPPVRVEMRDCCYELQQGEHVSHTGFVRRGTAVEMVSCEDAFHLVRAGGAAFFSLAFPDRDAPLRRRLRESGVVELSSAAGYFWMRGYLFVDDHPYYTHADAHGRFRLTQVPPGRYEVVCWLPNWIEERHERDPETSEISRVFFKPPVEQRQTVSLAAGKSSAIEFVVSADLFRGKLNP
jgi:hypothetical protein